MFVYKEVRLRCKSLSLYLSHSPSLSLYLSLYLSISPDIYSAFTALFWYRQPSWDTHISHNVICMLIGREIDIGSRYTVVRAQIEIHTKPS